LNDPRPEPDGLLVIVIHVTEGTAVHWQLDPVMMETLALRPVDCAVTFVGETV
jgi:hypothetical protein